MPIPLDKPEVLNREFLEIRARLLQVAASLDRLDRADGSVAGRRRGWLRFARRWRFWRPTSRTAPNAIQLMFSRLYDPN